MNHTSLTRRLLVGAAGLVIGGASALAVASPASAHHPIVDGEAVCDEATGEWVITWTVANSEDDLTGEIYNVVSSPAADLSPIANNATLPVSGDGPLTAEQRVSGDTTEASLAVDVKWNRDGTIHDRGDDATVDLGGECGKPDEPTPTPTPTPTPEPPELVGEVAGEFDCETLTLTITNNSEFEETFTVQPSEGDAVEVTVAAGEESEEVSFPSSEGLTVDVLVEDENGELVSALEDGPFEITSEDWAELECGADEGEGGELPVTGSSTTLIAGGAVALLAVGGGLFWLARRRRVTFTA